MTSPPPAASACAAFPPPFNASLGLPPPPSLNILENVETWEGIIMILGFGLFALVMSFLFLLVRRYVFFDVHLLDTFFDAGGDNNFALVAAAIVAKWLWTFAYTASSYSVLEAGVAGGFWQPVGSCLHVLLFAIVVFEFRIKSPGAKTFLQVIRVRFGPVTHIVVMIFAFAVNVIIAGLIMMEGTRILTALTDGIAKEVICILLTIAVGVYTIIGGVGGGLYMAYFACALVVSIMLTYFFDLFYNPLNRNRPQIPGTGSNITDYVCAATGCGKLYEPESVVRDNSLLTFFSLEGLCQGVVIFGTGFGPFFMNQSFWNGANLGKPCQAVWGFLTAGLTLFAIPFMLSFTFGMFYWVLAVQAGDANGMYLISEKDVLHGYLPVAVSQQLMGRTGDFMMYALTQAVVIAAVSSEVLSMSAIFMYDIYQTYVNPFTPCSDENKLCEFLSYNKRSVIIKYVVVIVFSLLVFPITLVLLAIEVDGIWLFNFVGVITSGCVVPVIASVAWHRTTWLGVLFGSFSGLAAGVTVWLIIAVALGEDGLHPFLDSTRHSQAFGGGVGAGLFVGGLVCIMFSWCCGGCDPNRNEEDVWEQCGRIDNPAMPWATKYSSDFCNVNRCTGRPHYFQLRRRYRSTEIAAYILNALLIVSLALVWPSLMLLADIFTCNTLQGWIIVIAVFGVVAAAFIGIIPLLAELLRVCKQAYYNRTCEHARLDETPSETASFGCECKPASRTTAVVLQPQPVAVCQLTRLPEAPAHTCGQYEASPRLQIASPPLPNAHAIRNNFNYNDVTSNAFVRVNSPTGGDALHNDRWKTFIHLD